MNTSRNILLIKITKSYKGLLEKGEPITDDRVYDCVRGRWHLSKERAEDVDYVLAVYNDVIVGVYSVASWHNCGEGDSAVNPNWIGEEPDRIYFTRNEKPSLEEIRMRGLLINKVAGMHNGQNPVSYGTLTCDERIEIGFCPSPDNL